MKIMVIDGNSIINRAYHGIRPLSNHEGTPTNAVYGFLSTLFKQEDEEKLINTLKMAGLYDDAMKLENKLDTTIFKSYDENGTELSGGQQQKTAICRALYRDSPIVILDEPTAALDPVAEYEIYKHFNKLVGGKTAIYISHRLSSCKFCDEIAVFADDTIKEYGTHEELVKIESGIYSEMYNAQAKYYVENVS